MSVNPATSACYNNAMAYTAAHTGYIPFDTDAPQIFNLQQTDNYLAGEYLVFLNTITSALSQLFCRQPHLL